MPKIEKQRTTVRLQQELHRALKNKSVETGESIEALLERAVTIIVGSDSEGGKPVQSLAPLTVSILLSVQKAGFKCPAFNCQETDGKAHLSLVSPDGTKLSVEVVKES